MVTTPLRQDSWWPRREVAAARWRQRAHHLDSYASVLLAAGIHSGADHLSAAAADLRVAADRLLVRSEAREEAEAA
jgi:hypothetical protein